MMNYATFNLYQRGDLSFSFFSPLALASHKHTHIKIFYINFYISHNLYVGKMKKKGKRQKSLMDGRMKWNCEIMTIKNEKNEKNFLQRMKKEINWKSLILLHFFISILNLPFSSLNSILPLMFIIIIKPYQTTPLSLLYFY